MFESIEFSPQTEKALMLKKEVMPMEWDAQHGTI